MTSSEITSGMTVMRMALTHSAPNGATKSAARTSAALCVDAMAIPMTIAATTASSTRVLSFIATSSSRRR